jgi:hypothetical protein
MTLKTIIPVNVNIEQATVSAPVDAFVRVPLFGLEPAAVALVATWAPVVREVDVAAVVVFGVPAVVLIEVFVVDVSMGLKAISPLQLWVIAVGLGMSSALPLWVVVAGFAVASVTQLEVVVAGFEAASVTQLEVVAAGLAVASVIQLGVVAADFAVASGVVVQLCVVVVVGLAVASGVVVQLRVVVVVGLAVASVLLLCVVCISVVLKLTSLFLLVVLFEVVMHTTRGVSRARRSNRRVVIRPVFIFDNLL